MSKVISTVFVIILFVVSLFAIAAWWFAHRSLPVLDGIVTIPSLSRPAQVKFDDRGIAYIEGSSDRDVYLVQGYMTAAERMFQMDISRRSAKGELSEVFGPNSLAHDKLMRTIGFNRLAQQDFKGLSADVKSALDAYTRGVNAYIESAQDRLPLEFVLLGYAPKQWQPTDTLAILKYNQYEQDESWRLDDLRQRVLDKAGDKVSTQLFNETLHQTEAAGSQPTPESSSLDEREQLLKLTRSRLNDGHLFAAPEPTWGSNAWVVASALSDTKGALLACDTHGALSSPDKFYLCSLTTPNLHVAGATIPGVPGIIVGRNADISWGGTSLKADVQDLVLEQFSPQFPGRYRTNTGWQNVTETIEDIPVRFGKPVVEKILSTRHGPILLKGENTGVCLQWTGADEKTPVLETLWHINRAKNWQQFSDAIAKYSGASRTFVFADRSGNIGYHAAGDIPIRRSTGSLLSPGWLPASDWTARVRFEDMAHGFNPSQHYAVADGPEFSGRAAFNNPYRPLRISAVLNSYTRSAQRPGLPEMAVLQADQYAPLSTLVKKEIRESIKRAELIDQFQRPALEMLDRWDGNVRADSAAASVYEAFINTLTRRVLEPKLGQDLTLEYMQRYPMWSVLIERILTEKPKEWLPPEERTYETFMLTTFADALKSLRVATKVDEPSKWLWQNVHQVTFTHALDDGVPLLGPSLGKIFNSGPVGVGGDQDTVNAVNVVFSKQPWSFVANTGPTQRLLVDMSDADKFYETITLGESGHYFSSYRQDQLRAWVKAEPHAIAFSSDQLEKQLQHKLLLSNQP